jgi:ArsR family transcriptional regulator
MGAIKSQAFDPDDLKMAKLFKALSYPARIAIVKCLISKERCCCGEIVHELPFGTSNCFSVY